MALLRGVCSCLDEAVKLTQLGWQIVDPIGACDVSMTSPTRTAIISCSAQSLSPLIGLPPCCNTVWKQSSLNSRPLSNNGLPPWTGRVDSELGLGGSDGQKKIVNVVE